MSGAADDDNESDSKVIEECINTFRNWSIEHADADVALKLEQLRTIQTIYSLRPALRYLVFLGGTCTESIITSKQLLQNKDVVMTLAQGTIQQRQLIAGLEWFFGSRYPQLSKYFPVILKQLFDEEMMEEDIFLEWAGDLTRNEYSVDDTMITFDALEGLRAAAAPFVTWLQEAEEEDDEEDEEEEDA